MSEELARYFLNGPVEPIEHPADENDHLFARAMLKAEARLAEKAKPRILPLREGERFCPFSNAKIRPHRCRNARCLTGRCKKLAERGLTDERKPVQKAQRPLCGAKTRNGGRCKARAVVGNRRCRMHGGLSAGPRTEEGLARAREARAMARGTS